jgi:glycosyltransferase involved in cell wall biosynthesis
VTAAATRQALHAVRTAPTLLQGLRRAEALASAVVVGRDDPAIEAVTLLSHAAQSPDDHLSAIAATRALGGVPGKAADDVLVELLDEGPSFLHDHAAGALGERTPVVRALPRLVSMVVDGDFGGMVAQRTLEQWAGIEPYAVRSHVEEALGFGPGPLGRARLVETLGLVPGAEVEARLRALVLDEDEGLAARAAAIGALGERGVDRADGPEGRLEHETTTAALQAVADVPGILAPAARLALEDLAGAAPPSDPSASGEPGLTVAQLFLHADIDGALSHAGRGDTGGIATLLVQLGDALLDESPRIRRVLTISRGVPTDTLDALDGIDEPGHHYLSIPLWGPPLHAAQAWPHRVGARRGIRRILRRAGCVDAIHLRMGDVGSMAAAEVARSLGVPIVLTLAPDPHALVASREAAGTLTRANFGEADEVEHLAFRVRLLQELERQAGHLVLFPRPELADDVRSLLGLDLGPGGEDGAGRVSVVAEGISLRAFDGQGPDHAAAPTTEALVDLDEVLTALPRERRGLPLAVSVGRLHRVKGMASLVEAWAGHPGLSARCNLLVIGGDLKDPTDDEEEQVALIGACVPSDLAAARGLLLAGHRPNATVAAWLRAVRRGRAPAAAPRGVYVSASLKEEFGIAILEAMAAGLVVVAPDSGGPATYVDDGVTGILVDTSSVAALAEAINAALDLAADRAADARAAQAQAMVRERFGIATMADALARIYDDVSAQRHTTGSASALAQEGPAT